ncbi:M56 family metallopeptidase [Dyadobacter crusticola]|uniref:M56 family metallopeptidase n=1 Tax=Dyadobacter crusticola TaxID=292407 RepID=UPI00068BFF65|nr:M56 family metallopeptidase [Dyadobacter crusticola]
MNAISTFFSSPIVPAFGWTLVHSVWQGTALLLIALATFFAFRNKSANLRYLSGIGFLLLQVIASATTFAYYYLQFSASASIQTMAAVTTASSHRLSMAGQTTYQLPLSLKMQLWLSAHLHELVICWLIGAGFLLMRFVGGWLFTERLRMNAAIVSDREWRARLGVILAKMNISKSVEFKETARILTPMVIGTLSPVILIPIGFLTGFSTSQVEAILAHELAHIKRNDYLVNMLQSFVEVVFFFHPAIWWLSDRVRAEREHCCDDIALSVCGDKMSLAHALVKVAEWQTAPRMAMAFASRKPLLLHRVQRVLGISPKKSSGMSTLPLVLFAISLVVGVSVYAVAQKSEKKQEQKTSKQITAKKAGKKRTIVKSDESETAEDFEADEVYVNIDEDLEDLDFNVNVNLDDIRLNINTDSLQRKLQALQNEMEPLQHRVEEINLEIEKQRFEVERVNREMEKIEWKKERAMDTRSELMDKRSEILNRNNNANQSKLSEADLDKQLSEFEQQIKVQEQQIANLNSQISAARKETLTAEEPLKKLESEMEDLNEKINEIAAKMGTSTLGMHHFDISPNVYIENVPHSPARARTQRKRVSPPPPPPAAPAKVARPARVPAPAAPAAPPAPPVPPAKELDN